MEHFETRRLHKSGRKIPISVSISPVKDAFGRVVGASKVARDISEKLLWEEKQALLSSIVESSDDAIVSKNLDGIIMSWNRGAQEIFGYSEAEVLGKSIKLLIPEERLQEEDQILRKIRNGINIDHFETVRKHKTGRMLPVSITVSPLRDSNGKIIGASKVARDITTRIQSQAARERYTGNLESLNTIGKSLSETLDVQKIIQRVTDATTLLTEAQFGAFVQYTDSNTKNPYKLSSLSGTFINNTEELEIDQSSQIFHPLFIDKKVIRVDNKDLNEDWIQPFCKKTKRDHLTAESYLAVPVVLKSGNKNLRSKKIGGQEL